jgi:hypothetical protein
MVGVLAVAERHFAEARRGMVTLEQVEKAIFDEAFPAKGWPLDYSRRILTRLAPKQEQQP